MDTLILKNKTEQGTHYILEIWSYGKFITRSFFKPKGKRYYTSDWVFGSRSTRKDMVNALEEKYKDA